MIVEIKVLNDPEGATRFAILKYIDEKWKTITKAKAKDQPKDKGAEKTIRTFYRTAIYDLRKDGVIQYTTRETFALTTQVYNNS